MMAAEYSRELSDKILQAQLRQAKLGFRQGGPTPFGFRRALIGPDGRTLRWLDRGERKAITGDMPDAVGNASGTLDRSRMSPAGGADALARFSHGAGPARPGGFSGSAAPPLG